MHSISNHIADVRSRIAHAAHSAGRQRDSVRLVAVSKTQGIDKIRAAIAAGIAEFGENYVGDALPKIAALRDRAIVLAFHRCRSIEQDARHRVQFSVGADARSHKSRTTTLGTASRRRRTARRIDPDQYRRRTAEGRHRAGGSGRIRGAHSRDAAAAPARIDGDSARRNAAGSAARARFGACAICSTRPGPPAPVIGTRYRWA